MEYKKYIILCMVVIAAAAGITLRAMDPHREFSGDETILLEISQLDAKDALRAVIEKEVYPPFTYLAAHYLMALGRSQVWVRVYFALFGIGSCIIVYMIAKELFDAAFAVIPFVLCLFSPLQIFASRYTRNYIDSAFWMLLSCLFMLRILKGKEGFLNWLGYVISMVMGLYTFYFSALLFMTQCLFVTLVWARDVRPLRRWYLAYFAAALAFLPWLPFAVHQLSNASGAYYNWANKGFNIWLLRPGLYVKSVLSLFGFDPYFMIYQGGIRTHFSKIALAAGTVFCAVVFAAFLCYYIWSLKRRYPNRADLVWFVPFMSLGPVILSWMAIFLLNLLPTGRYLVAFNALFLIAISAVVYRAWEKRPAIGIALLSFVLLIFAARAPHAVAVEFGNKAAIAFLKGNADSSEPIICTRSCPDVKGLNFIDITDRFTLNRDKAAYILAQPGGLDNIEDIIRPFRRIWVYRVYGNAEIFGANRLLSQWLWKQGYSRTRAEKFRNIDVVAYEK